MRRAGVALILLLSGCAGPSPGSDDGTATQAPPPPATPQHVPFDFPFDGHLQEAACVPDGASETCTRINGTGAPDESQVFIGVAGAVEYNGTLTLTWSSQDPNLQQLQLAAVAVPSCQGCQGVGTGDAKQGASPLVLELSGAAFAGKPCRLRITVTSPETNLPEPLRGWAHAGLDFHLDGRMSATLPGPTPSP